MLNIWVKGNYFYLEDTDTGLIHDAHSKDVKITKETKNGTSFHIRNVKGWEKENIAIPFTQLRKEGGVSWSNQAEFETFYSDETGGFSSALGGSGARFYVGVIDYGDTSTTATPIVISAGNGNLETWIDLPNDGLGVFSVNTVSGVDNIIDVSTGQFDLNELGLGDKIDFRIDLSVTSNANNNTVKCRLLLGGLHVDAFELNFANRFYSQTESNDSYVFSTEFDIGEGFLLTNNSKLQVWSEKSASIINNGIRNYVHM